MSNRFIFFFLSTFIMLSVYFGIENTSGNNMNSLDNLLDIVLYIFDYFLFVGYLMAKYIRNKKISILFIALGFFLLICYSFIEQFYLTNQNDFIRTHFFFISHIIARTFILVSFLLEIKIPRKFILKNIIINIVVISTVIFAELQIASKHGVAGYNIKLHLILYILEIFIFNLALLNPTKNKSLYYIFIISALVSIITDFLSIQNQIYFSSIFRFTITRVGNTLAELGLVYTIINLAENSLFPKKKYLKNGYKKIRKKSIYRR